MPYTCPNKAWSGCTHADHVFKYQKSANKHAAKCEMARKQSESEEMDLRPLVKQLVKRINELEQSVEVLKEDNRSLRQLMRSATVRGPYEIRGEGDTPSYGFGNWSDDFFLQNVVATDEFYLEKVGLSAHSTDKRVPLSGFLRGKRQHEGGAREPENAQGSARLPDESGTELQKTETRGDA